MVRFHYQFPGLELKTSRGTDKESRCKAWPVEKRTLGFPPLIPVNLLTNAGQNRLSSSAKASVLGRKMDGDVHEIILRILGTVLTVPGMSEHEIGQKI